jgi:TolB-like protein/Tfp pilus assembly protein PilF
MKYLDCQRQRRCPQRVLWIETVGQRQQHEWENFTAASFKNLMLVEGRSASDQVLWIGRGAWDLRQSLLEGVWLVFVCLECSNCGSSAQRHLPGDSLNGQPAFAQSVAVLPFQNLSSDFNQEYLVDGMTDKVITELARLGGMTVISRTSAMTYKGAKQRLPEIARELNVDAIIEGSVLKTRSRLRITAQLIELPADKHLWAQSYERESGDILTLQEEVAFDITRQVQRRLQGPVQTQVAGQRRTNTTAYNAYLLGRYFWNRRTDDGFHRAIEYFNQAIEKDPRYAAAYAGLADCYLLLGASGSARLSEADAKARSAAARALELDPTLAEPYATLGAVDTAEHDSQRAERELRRAIELSPAYATAHQRYAELLAGLGRFDQALVEIMFARELDPVSMVINTQVGFILYMARRYDEAAEQLRNTTVMDPNFCLAHSDLGLVYQQKMMFPEAILEARKAVDLCGSGSKIWLARAYGLAGQPERGRRILSEAEPSLRTPVNAPYVALAYLAVGDKPHARSLLKRAIELNTIAAQSLEAPFTDAFRSDPQCAALLRQAGILK